MALVPCGIHPWPSTHRESCPETVLLEGFPLQAPSAPSKDPRAVARGKLGARTRWGPPRVVRLDTLHPAVAEAVRALVAAAESSNEKSPTVIETPAGLVSGQVHDDHLD